MLQLTVYGIFSIESKHLPINAIVQLQWYLISAYTTTHCLTMAAKGKALFEFTTPANAQVLNLNIYNLPDKNLFPKLKKSRFLVEKPLI